MYNYGCLALLNGRNPHNVVKLFFVIFKIKKIFLKDTEPGTSHVLCTVSSCVGSLVTFAIM